MTGLHIEGLCAGYGKRRILSGLDLTVAPGEIVALLGANGCGKTTLLRAVSGAIPIAAGKIMVDGVDLSTLSVRERANLVAAMSQENAAEAGLTGMDRIEMSFFPVKGLFGCLTAEERDHICALAEEFGILPLLTRDLAAMSAGERQLIALLAAAVRRTPILLLDEPTSALDFNRTEELFALLHRLAEQGRAILIVLHDPTQALRHATKLLRFGEDGTEWIDLRCPNYDTVERSLRRLYPHLRIHRDPLFCLTECENIENTGKEANDADH